MKPTLEEAQRQIGLAHDMLKSCVGVPFTASERDDCQRHLTSAFNIIAGLAHPAPIDLLKSAYVALDGDLFDRERTRLQIGAFLKTLSTTDGKANNG